MIEDLNAQILEGLLTPIPPLIDQDLTLFSKPANFLVVMV